MIRIKKILLSATAAALLMVACLKDSGRYTYKIYRPI